MNRTVLTKELCFSFEYEWKCAQWYCMIWLKAEKKWWSGMCHKQIPTWHNRGCGEWWQNAVCLITFAINIMMLIMCWIFEARADLFCKCTACSLNSKLPCSNDVSNGIIMWTLSRNATPLSNLNFYPSLISQHPWMLVRLLVQNPMAFLRFTCVPLKLGHGNYQILSPLRKI